jgi:probable HAF family extracellular repeat protein
MAAIKRQTTMNIKNSAQRLLIRHLGILALLTLVASGVFGQVRYSVTDLGTLGAESWAFGINNMGQVVGISVPAESYYSHAFLYSDGRMTDLGTLPGGAYSYATGINNNGQVVGYSGSNGDFSDHGFLYSGGQMTQLGNLPGGTYGRAMGINNNGQVVGYSGSNGGGPQACLFSGNNITYLGTSFANAINNNGQIAGVTGTADGSAQAMLYSSGSIIGLGILPGGNYSVANALNDHAQVVGYSGTYQNIN